MSRFITNFSKTKIVTLTILSLGLFYLGINISFLLFSPLNELITFIPDDSFYYFTLAKNFNEFGTWTFDSGVSLTTGFHLLHAYALTILDAIGGFNDEDFIRAGILLSIIAFLPVAIIALTFIIRKNDPYLALLFIIIINSNNILLNIISGMEWGWVVTTNLFVVLSFYIKSFKASLTCLFLLGILGSLSRADFGLISFCFFAVAATGTYLKLVNIQLSYKSASALLGSSVGLFIVFFHNYYFTGEILQSSAQMKKLWMQVYGPSIFPILREIISVFGEFGAILIILVFCLFAGTLYFGAYSLAHKWSNRNKLGQLDISDYVWASSALVIGSYIILYTFNSAALQNWYTANIAISVFLFLSLCSCSYKFIIPKYTILSLMLGMHVWDARYQHQKWPWQKNMMEAGIALRDTNLQGKIGAWNAGIIGYFQGGGVINLDGLVNNDIYHYAKYNELDVYIDSVGIKYIVDFDIMLDDSNKILRGGYNNQDFLSRLQLEKTYGHTYKDQPYKMLGLYKVKNKSD